MVIKKESNKLEKIEKLKEFKLTPFVKDTLTEVGGIAANKASTALSKMIGSSVQVSMTHLVLVPLKAIHKHVKIGVAYSIFFQVSGDINGSIALLKDKHVSHLLVRKLLKKKGSHDTENLNPLEEDTLKEVGNIIIGAYLAGLSDMSGLNLLESVPHLKKGPIEEIIDNLVENAKNHTKEKQVLIIETSIRIKADNFAGKIFFVLSPKACTSLFNALLEKI